MFFALSLIAGAVQVIAPDHWMPLSLASWQRRWGPSLTILYAAGALLLHLAAGVGLYFAIRPILSSDPKTNFRIALAIVMALFLLRSIRFQKIGEVLRKPGKMGLWNNIEILAFLGPCEVFVPIMIKGHQLGFPYLSSIAAFGAGAVVMGIGLVCMGRLLWNEPLVLIRTMDWASAGKSMLPFTLAVSFGLFSLLRI